MKTWKKWLAGISLGVVVAVVGVGIWQRENVQALWEGMSYTEEELKGQMETTKEKTQQALKEYELEGIRDLTLEEEEQLMKGEISVEQALDLIMNQESQPTLAEKEALAGKYELDKPIAVTESEEAAEATQVETKQIVEAYVSKMYTLQATFLGDLGAIEAKARAAFAKLPKEERNLNAAKKLAPAFISEGLALERKCDGEVSTLLEAFESELQAAGGDTAIVKTMREAYQSQKRLKKSSYLSAIK